MKSTVLLCMFSCITLLANAQIQEYNNVLIGTDSPALGVNIKTTFPNYTGDWYRGFSISNQNNSNSFLYFGGYGTSINGISQLKYGFIGADCTSPFISFLVNGNIGIGTKTPTSQLHLASDTDHALLISRTNGEYGFRIFRNAAEGNVYFQIGNTANSWETKIKIGEGEGSNSRLLFNPQGGNVGIGTENPTNKLDVNGTIRAKEVKVESNWADFVFKPDYQLRPLSEVAQFINANGHLPEIPTEKEVTQNGVSLGEMNVKLLQKIEELTLYLIKKENEIKYLNEKMSEINQRLDKLSKQ